MNYSSINVPNGFYVYMYLRSNGTPYYVGKGSGKRAWDKHSSYCPRPRDENKIIITHSSLTELWAFAIERQLIRWYGRENNKTGILRNLTDGGDGGCGRVMSEETRNKISVAHTGRIHTDKSRSNMSNGQKGKKYSDEARRNMSLAAKGKPKSKEHVEKVSAANRGKKRTIEQRSKCASFGMLDKRHSQETKQKMRLAQLGFKHELQTCPHCGTVGGGGNMTRYHFNKCKLNPSNIKS
jgi:hypothetical protein